MPVWGNWLDPEDLKSSDVSHASSNLATGTRATNRLRIGLIVKLVITCDS